MSTRAALCPVTFIVLAMIVSAHAQGRGAPPPQTGTGFIAGRVMEGNTTRPVLGAIVTLFGPTVHRLRKAINKSGCVETVRSNAPRRKA